MSEKKSKPFREAAKESWEKGCETGKKLGQDRARLRLMIASNIRKCRHDARLTQEEVSEKIDANPLTYKGYENCRSDVPAIYLVRIADFYGISVDYLLGRTETKEPYTTTSIEDRVTKLEQLLHELATKKD